MKIYIRLILLFIAINIHAETYDFSEDSTVPILIDIKHPKTNLILVKIHWFKNHKQLITAWNDDEDIPLSKIDASNLEGWTSYEDNITQDGYLRCNIYVVKPKFVFGEKMEILGHELSHCFFGDFHN